jgi:hypothetical protein
MFLCHSTAVRCAWRNASRAVGALAQDTRDEPAPSNKTTVRLGNVRITLTWAGIAQSV